MSHTTTGEWKSFEVRMRRRRAERLIVRAEVAADAGFIEDARACLAEARRLAPGMGAIDAVERKLTAPPAPAAVARTRVWPGAAAMLMVLTLGGWLLRPHSLGHAPELQTLPPAAFPEPATAAAALPTTAGAADTLPPPAPATAAPATQAASASRVAAQPYPVAEPTAGRTDATAPTSAATPRNERNRNPMAELDNRNTTARLLAAPGLPAATDSTPVRALDTPSSSTVTPIPVDGEVAAVAAAIDSLPLPARPTLPATSSTPTTPSATVPAPRADASVRNVLDRYAAAYSALDADAAQRIWPRVNHAALTRAFDSLASQQVSLGECRIDISGAAARASCAGTATWSPKIGGGGERTEARRWTFELARAGSDWRIVNALVQNR